MKLGDNMKKGFTLIELLAVLVVLAVLAIIAVPSVLKIVDDSKMGTFKDGGLGILNAAKQSYVKYAGREMVVHMDENIIYLDGEKTTDTIEYKGTKPKGGYVMITKDGKTSMAIYNDNYCAYKRETDDEVSAKRINSSSECTLDKITD